MKVYRFTGSWESLYLEVYASFHVDPSQCALTPQDLRDVISGVVCTPAGRTYAASFDGLMAIYDDDVTGKPRLIGAKQAHAAAISAATFDSELNRCITCAPPLSYTR